MIEALDIQVKGIVQGVGFRPFVYRLAKKYLINGWVLNAADGVFIHAEGESKLLDEFVVELSEQAPAAAQVTEIDLKEVPLEDFTSFEIRFSNNQAVQKTTLVSPDLATCEDCARELFNPNDRRFRYPFINCTNCGPRFTIIEKLPYDRASTSMKEFPMCQRCANEYRDPLDRRFHAQPDACFECGPHLSLAYKQPVSEEGEAEASAPKGAATQFHVEWGRTRQESDQLLAQAVDLLLEGKILAVKGLGGFHLVCDANNAKAVALLRQRKRREGKAFAVMMPSTEAVRQVCKVSAAEAKVLESAQRPIVLLRKHAQATFAPGLADRLPELGVMLPYTPVQHLLLHDFAKACTSQTQAQAQTQTQQQAQTGSSGSSAAPDMPPMLVMTSGNVHDEPIVMDDEEAYEKLSGIADAFLGNNRPICARYDDSVVRVIDAGGAGEAVQFIRRARGYAPLPLALPEHQAEHQANGQASADPCPRAIFAVGPEQKNTFTLTRDTEAFVSQHIGDIENAETYDAWLQAKNRYETLFDIQPAELACDLHPEYLTTKWAQEQSRQQHLPLTEVQHHHAHIVAAMAEHAIAGPVCGIAFDGTGYGVDGAIWGGEVLLSNTQAFERFANFAYVPMPGGAAAVRHPLRMAYGALWAFDLLEHPGAAEVLEALGNQAAVCDQMIEQGINTPMTSSVGRLFDAASALLGISTQPTYEGEPAILLEAALYGAPESAAAPASGSAAPTPSSTPNAAPAAAPADAPASTSEAEETEAEAAERYAIGITKNTATATSTAQDTSVVLFDAAPTFQALLDDKVAGVPTSVIAQRFHNAFVQAIVAAAELVRGLYDIATVVLSGGVFMNRYLIEHALAALEEAGFTVAINRDLPPNDGCISFGQAVVAWASKDEK